MAVPVFVNVYCITIPVQHIYTEHSELSKHWEFISMYLVPGKDTIKYHISKIKLSLLAELNKEVSQLHLTSKT